MVKRSDAWRWGTAAAVVIGMAVVGMSPAAQRVIADAVAWCAGAGWLGVLVYGVLYSASTVLVFPAAVLTAAAGWGWGLVEGSLIVLGVSLFADWVPFTIARRLGRARVAAAAEHARTLRALDEAFRSQGFLLVALLRLSPIAPYNVTNYLLGLTPVSTVTYLVASTIGSLPGVLVICYLGTLVPQAADLGDVGVAGVPWLFAAAIALSLIAYGAVVIIARRALRRVIAA